MSCSKDGTIQLYDSRVMKAQATLNAGQNGSRHPVYSIDASKNIICAGTHEDIVVWDIANMKKPLYRFVESHNEDVTCLQLYQDQLISCSIDNVLSMFTLKAGSTEEDMIEGAYSSTQPLIACGFVNSKVIWTLTSINTVELLRVEDATCFLNISKVSSLL